MPKAPIACPHALGGKIHPLKTNAIVKPLGLLRCTHRPAAEQGECGATVLLLALPFGWHYVIEISPEDFRRIEPMSHEESMAYLLSGRP